MTFLGVDWESCDGALVELKLILSSLIFFAGFVDFEDFRVLLQGGFGKVVLGSFGVTRGLFWVRRVISGQFRVKRN